MSKLQVDMVELRKEKQLILSQYNEASQQLQVSVPFQLKSVPVPGPARKPFKNMLNEYFELILN